METKHSRGFNDLDTRDRRVDSQLEHLPPQELDPNDRVVELAALVRLVSLPTGGISAAWAGWVVRGNWLASLTAVLPGVAAGYVVSQIVSSVVYRTADGKTRVVKVGSGSIAVTIPAGLAGGVSTAIVIVASALFLTTEGRTARLAGVPL